MKSREQVADELSRLQRDNESLQGKHRLHTELQQQEDFQMPNAVQVREAPVAPLIRRQLQVVFCRQALAASSQAFWLCSLVCFFFL